MEYKKLNRPAIRVIMKLQAGANQFRIVTSGDDGGVIQGMLGWANNDDGSLPTIPGR